MNFFFFYTSRRLFAFNSEIIDRVVIDDV